MRVFNISRVVCAIEPFLVERFASKSHTCRILFALADWSLRLARLCVWSLPFDDVALCLPSCADPAHLLLHPLRLSAPTSSVSGIREFFVNEGPLYTFVVCLYSHALHNPHGHTARLLPASHLTLLCVVDTPQRLTTRTHTHTHARTTTHANYALTSRCHPVSFQVLWMIINAVLFVT